MKKHAESHMDHGFTQSQWDYIFTKYADKTAFFIDTFELPVGLGTVTNELYGPSAGDPPVRESEVVYGKRGDRAWDSRLVLKPKRPTKFVRIIAGPHEEKCTTCDGKGILPSSPFSWYSHGPHEVECLECQHQGVLKHACILYTAYGVPSIDAPQSSKEPGDLFAQLWAQPVVESLVLWYRDLLAAATGDVTISIDRVKYARMKVDEWDALEKAHEVAQVFWKQHGLAAPLSMMPCPTCGAAKMGDAVYDPPEPDTDGRCQTCGTL